MEHISVLIVTICVFFMYARRLKNLKKQNPLRQLRNRRERSFGPFLSLLTIVISLAYSLRAYHDRFLWHGDDCTSEYVNAFPSFVEEGDYFPEMNVEKEGSKIFVEVSHGLGNRLRALLTAAVAAQRTQKKLYLIWPRDVHMNASFHDLLHLDGIQVFENSFLSCALKSSAFIVYDYLNNPVDETKRKKVDFTRSRNIYIRTAYRVHELGASNTFSVDNILEKELQALQPKPIVKQLMFEKKKQLWDEHAISIRDVTGVHIRMQDELEKDIPGIGQLPRTDVRRITPRMEEVALHRRRCHVNHFIDRIRLDMLESRGRVYFISSDSHEARDTIEGALGPHFFSSRDASQEVCFGPLARTKECIQHATAELLLLSKTRFFIYSEWSSFSEVVSMIGDFDRRMKSGCA